jgi:anti-sigma regulatory factor (Ser/Thr protein kinase)
MVSVCAEIGRPELADCAEMALSEVVTNAILHARGPISMRLRGVLVRPRVEVVDSSPEPPTLPRLEFDLDALDEIDDLSTFGRGLAIVAHCSDAWGADRDVPGKVVWFVPASAPKEFPVAGELHGWELPEPADDSGERIPVTLRGAPVELVEGAVRHAAELQRELRLLALDHEESYPVANDLSEFFSALVRDFRGQFLSDELMAAREQGRPRVDLQVRAPLDSGTRFTRLAELLDLADAFCRAERLLILARSPLQVEFQRWFCNEFVRQSAGEQPLSWTPPAALAECAHP